MPVTCPYPEPDQSSPCPPQLTSWRSILILFSHLCLGIPSCHFPSGFPHQNPVETSLSPIRVKCPANLILDLITRIIFDEEYRSLSSSLRIFLHSSVISPLLGPNILISTPFSNNLSLLVYFILTHVYCIFYYFVQWPKKCSINW